MIRARLNDKVAAHDIPSILDAESSAPYSYGALMVDALRARGGQAAVDGVFHQPPHDDRSVLVVEARKTRPQLMHVPPPVAGEQNVHVDRLGTVGLFHVLASRLDPGAALIAAEQRRNDVMVTTRRSDGATCVHLSIATGGTAGRARLVDALTAWAAKGPTGAAMVDPGETAVGVLSGRARDDAVRFTTCETPGAPAPAQFAGPATLAVLRGEVVAAGLRAHAGTPAIECAADGLVQDAGVQAALPVQLDRVAPSNATLRRAITEETAAAKRAWASRSRPVGSRNASSRAAACLRRRSRRR